MIRCPPELSELCQSLPHRVLITLLRSYYNVQGLLLTINMAYMDDGKWKANGTLAGDSDTDRTRRSGMHGHGTSPSGENKGG